MTTLRMICAVLAGIGAVTTAFMLLMANAMMQAGEVPGPGQMGFGFISGGMTALLWRLSQPSQLPPPPTPSPIRSSGDEA